MSSCPSCDDGGCMAKGVDNTRMESTTQTVTKASALNSQEGGDHYKDYAIQPIEFITENKLGFIEGNVVKYICRHRSKNGAEDIKKAIHYLQLLLELEYELI